MTLYIVCEDQLSEVVMRKMLTGCSTLSTSDIIPLSKRGRGYIHSRINEFNNQNNIPFFILADLDSDECAPGLIKMWMKQPLKQNILLRIAVREIESWLIADTKGLSRYLRLDHAFIKKEVNIPDNLPNPKEKLISLVDRSNSRSLKNDIVRNEKGSYKQGPGYNSRLTDYVNNYWNIKLAAASSNSLKRAIDSIIQFNPSLNNGKYL